MNCRAFALQCAFQMEQCAAMSTKPSIQRPIFGFVWKEKVPNAFSVQEVNASNIAFLMLLDLQSC